MASLCRSAQADPGWLITYDYEYVYDYDSVLVQLMILMLMLSLIVMMKEKNMMILDHAYCLHYRHHAANVGAYMFTSQYDSFAVERCVLKHELR